MTDTASAGQDAPEDRRTGKHVLSGTARIATATGVRQVLTAGAMAFTAAVVARCLGPRGFGLYAGGTAAFNLTLSLCDFGFSLTLVRELSKRSEDSESLMGVGLAAQMGWSCALTAILATTGILTGGTRGLIMVVLAPALALSGMAVSRQIFTVRFRPVPLLLMDISTTLLQCAVMLGLALAHLPIVTLAINLCFWTCLSSLLALILARREVSVSKPNWAAVRRFAKMALPLGVASVLASLYFTIDMTLLGWLVKPAALGRYAAAVRLLNLVVMIPGFVMAAGIPGLTWSAERRSDLSRFAATLAKWIALTALPLGVAVAVFARPAVLILFGSAYLGAVPLIRILMLAALLAFGSNILGITMMSLGIIRPQIIFNAISLVVNVAGNFLLVPRYGVTASAWLTVASEAIVFSYGAVALRTRISYSTLFGEVWRPLVAAVAGAGVGVLLGASSALAIMTAVIAWGAVTLLVVPETRSVKLGRRAAPQAVSGD